MSFSLDQRDFQFRYLFGKTRSCLSIILFMTLSAPPLIRWSNTYSAFKPGQVRSYDFRLTKGGGMARKRYTAEEMIGHLRTVEIETGKGLGTVAPVGSWASQSRRIIGGRKNMAACVSIRRSG
jgi:hypothetical protein